ncbi:MAG: hypothetical protein ACLFWM_08315 [Actinomycetota bacterium]
MEDFPARLASFLEDIAGRARALTVDRAAKAIRLTTLGMIAAAFAFMALVYFFLTVYGALEIPLGEWGAFAVLAGLFLVAGAFMWGKRNKD